MATDPRRIFPLNHSESPAGPVVYWMQRDQRIQDNHALLYAREEALARRQPLIVIFCLVNKFLGATARQFGFMIRGLEMVEKRLKEFNIPFILMQGNPLNIVPGFLEKSGAGLLVTDFNPLRITSSWRVKLAQMVNIPFVEVDAHNIIPCRYISDKPEYAAFTLRKKTEKLLPEFLDDFPSLEKHPFPTATEYGTTDWEATLHDLKADRSVGEVDWLTPGEPAALAAMDGFLATRLDGYAADRNFPDKKGQSDLSPYLHFGQLSAQRLALEVQRSHASAESKQAFLEELIVRRELSDNFCLYNPDYDRFSGFQPWAKTTLNRHLDDVREYCYSPEQFEAGETHDPLWNAAQQEMVKTGKMHGYMRMYWAKKILEWTGSPEEAMETAIFLNDRYQLDGRDPNGYAGIAWAIGGTHDRPWGERPVFGMIRYMNFQGCKRKFDVEKYIQSVNSNS
jgi:deoxyribodipyrimidine photo-lyase